MDNATFHKCQDTQNIIRKARHTLLFLPPYSPDLNPIEQKWASIKAVRKQLLYSIEQLFQIESFYMGQAIIAQPAPDTDTRTVIILAVLFTHAVHPSEETREQNQRHLFLNSSETQFFTSVTKCPPVLYPAQQNHMYPN